MHYVSHPKLRGLFYSAAKVQAKKNDKITYITSKRIFFKKSDGEIYNIHVYILNTGYCPAT
jgi:hypothetical protein